VKKPRHNEDVEDPAQPLHILLGRMPRRWPRDSRSSDSEKRWQYDYPVMVSQLERDLPELFAFFSFPRHLQRKLRTISVG